MRLIRDNKVITATEKSYNLLYKQRGYVPYNEDGVEVIKYDNITKQDIIEKLEEDGIEHNPRDKKHELFELLGSD